MKKNLIYQWAYQILTMILPVITTPYISRVLGADNIGIFSYQYAIVNYFMLFAMLGVNTYGSRCIAQKKDDFHKVSAAFSEIYFAQVMVSCIVSVFYVIYTFYFSRYRMISLIQMIYVIGCLFDINWFYFGLEQFKITVARNFIVKITTVCLIFLFVKSENDLYRYVFIMAFGTIISQCVMWFSFHSYGKLVWVPFSDIVRHYKGLLILFIPTIATSVYKMMDKIMLGSMSGMAEVGYYENSEKVINLLLTFLTSVGTVMLPRISNLVVNKKEEQAKRYMDRSMEVIMLISSAAAFGIVSVTQEFVPLFFGNGYEKCVQILNILSMSIIFSAAAQVIRTQYLIPYGYDLGYSMSLVLGAAVNVIANSLLIVQYGAAGAAAGTFLAEMTVCIAQFVIAAKNIDIFHYIAQTTVFLAMGLMMYLCIKLVPDVDNRLLSIVLKIGAGVVVYGTLSVIYFAGKYKKSV